MFKKEKIKIFAALCLCFFCGAIIYFCKFTNILPPYSNQEAGCVNCISQVGMAMRMYSHYYDGHFPAGKDTPFNSLTLLIDHQGDSITHCLTSHALQEDLKKYYKKNKTIPEELCCYRYNEGLTDDAPADCILMYYCKPIKWSSWQFPTKEEGRLVIFVLGSKKFLPEKEFQKFQKKTIDWIKKNKEKHNENE